MKKQNSIQLTISETSGIDSFQEPVTVGVPFPEGVLSSSDGTALFKDEGDCIPLQTSIVSNWPDGSVKWLLLDFFAHRLAKSTVNYYLVYKVNNFHQHAREKMRINDEDKAISVDTGSTIFSIDRNNFIPFKSVRVSGTEMLDAQESHVVLTDGSQMEFHPVVKCVEFETVGAVRSTAKFEGIFSSSDGTVIAEYIARMSFYFGKNIVKMDFTIKNPKAAKHPGGLWDLGDPGSVFFKDLSMHVSLESTSKIDIMWKTQLNNSFNSANSNNLIIYQDSSGGENWDSPVHVNKDGLVKNRFRGYRVTSDRIIEEGHRASPSVAIRSGEKVITAAIQNFWQNFPKSLEVKNNAIVIRLFPEQYDDMFELQGGEQKTHSVYIHFGSGVEEPEHLDWVQSPLVVRAPSEWYSRSMALGYISPFGKDKNPEYQKLVNNAIEGDSNFFLLREKIDEYGWRHFGDVYANHEIVSYKGSSPLFVSHYNNQYDVVLGCIYQFARGGDERWYQLARDLAKHVVDIDIYHTKNDRPAFSGGMFWHTNHFMHAETSTHRSYSLKSAELNGLKNYGGGPFPEHCYTTGLCKYYFLTGDIMAKEAVIELADWIMNVDKMEKSLFGIMRKIKRISYLLRNEYRYAPGRAEANSLNTLLDAYELTADKRYLARAESIINKFISPSDDINKLDQQEMGFRWFYLIFLQSLGKYLDLKDNIGERDEMFKYARESMIHHIKWMLKNEKPYKEMFHRVEIPSSTWCAQDIRKSSIFDYAFKYAIDQSLRNECKARAEYFYNASINDVLSYEDSSSTFVRVLAIMINYGMMHTYFKGLPVDVKQTEHSHGQFT